jgi:hypothetical protein
VNSGRISALALDEVVHGMCETFETRKNPLGPGGSHIDGLDCRMPVKAAGIDADFPDALREPGKVQCFLLLFLS